MTVDGQSWRFRDVDFYGASSKTNALDSCADLIWTNTSALNFGEAHVVKARFWPVYGGVAAETELESSFLCARVSRVHAANMVRISLHGRIAFMRVMDRGRFDQSGDKRLLWKHLYNHNVEGLDSSLRRVCFRPWAQCPIDLHRLCKAVRFWKDGSF